jgi:hypothetical protein
MKILQGSLNEVRFAWPESSRISKQESADNSRDHKVLKETSREQLHLNEVAYINGKLKQALEAFTSSVSNYQMLVKLHESWC